MGQQKTMGVKQALVIIIFGILLLACMPSKKETAQEDATQVSEFGSSLYETAATLKTEISCVQAGGVWRRVGRLQRDACILPASDAGKACRDIVDCTIDCLWDGEVAVGQPVIGQCQADTDRFGCRTEVRDGKAAGTLCVD